MEKKNIPEVDIPPSPLLEGFQRKRPKTILGKYSNMVVQKEKAGSAVSIFKKYKNLDIGGIVRVWKALSSKLDASRVSEEKKEILYHTALLLRNNHNKGLIHQNLSWDSVQVSNEGELVVNRNLNSLNELVPETLLLLQQTRKHSSNVYSFGMMMYTLLWERFDPTTFEHEMPYITRIGSKCPSCGKVIKENFLGVHIVNCDLRPLLDESKKKEVSGFVIDLMEECWKGDPFLRPSFIDICSRFEVWLGKKEFVSLTLQFPKHKDLGVKDLSLVSEESKFTLDNVSEWLEKKFQASKIVELRHSSFGILKDNSDLEKLKRFERRKTQIRVDSKLEIQVEFDSFSDELVKHFKLYKEEEEEEEGEEEKIDVYELINRIKSSFQKVKDIDEEGEKKIRMVMENLIKEKMIK